MNRSALLRTGTFVTGFGSAALAAAQPLAVMPPQQWTFIAVLGGMGMLLALGIIAVVFFNESRKNRDKLATVERLVAGGQPVPRELMTNEPRLLTLAEQYRHDIRRAITFLCWGIGISVVFYILPGGVPRGAAWGLLLIVPGLGNFLKAWLTAREIARGSAGGQR